jgi:hypothetical protein
LAGELAALRAADPGSTVSEGWEAAAGATVQALEAAESRLRELARAATVGRCRLNLSNPR